MPARRNAKRRGWALLDVVTVLCCCVLLLAVATPALTSIQSRARQLFCRNNLKVMGLALHNYHDIHRTFPPGWVSLSELPDAGPRYGWQTFLLPQIEQKPILDLIDFNPPMPAAKGLLQREIEWYRCPADPTPSTNPLRGNYATSNYSGNYGTRNGSWQGSPSLGHWLSPRRTAFWPGQLPAVEQADGLFWRNSNVRIANILDGTSNTFMVGERSAKSGAGIWPGVQSNQFTSDVVTDCSAGNMLNSGFNAFSSYHEGGANFLFVDGSVHFIRNTIDPKVYSGLSTRNGAERIWDKF